MNPSKKPSPLKRYVIKVWYVGIHFSGSQRQPDKRTVEGVLLSALSGIGYIENAAQSTFRAAGRMDAGVSVREAAFAFSSSEIFRIRHLDSVLPEDLGVVSWAEVPLDYNPRFKSTGKEYRYFLMKSAERQLNFMQMDEAIHIFEGEHDFTLFSKTDPTKDAKLSILTIEKTDISDTPQYYMFRFMGRKFLWQQIRRMMTTLVDIGRGEMSMEELSEKFEPAQLNAPQLSKCPPISPYGLILWSINFDSSVVFHGNEFCNKRRQKNLSKIHNQLKEQANAVFKLIDFDF